MDTDLATSPDLTAALADLALAEARYDERVRQDGPNRVPVTGLRAAEARVREARAAAGIPVPAPAPRVPTFEEQVRPFARALTALAVSYAAARFAAGEGVEAVWHRSVGAPLPVLVLGGVMRLPNGRLLTGRWDVRTTASAAQAA